MRTWNANQWKPAVLLIGVTPMYIVVFWGYRDIEILGIVIFPLAINTQY